MITIPTKPNPGCKIPDLKGIPDVSKYLTETLPQELLQSLIPDTEAQKLAELVEDIQGTIDEWTKSVQRRLRTLNRLLEIPCPLPTVPDASQDLDIPGPHDVMDDAGGQVTLGESLFIAEDEF